MPAKSKAQQRFFGMVRAAQKGEGVASPEVAKVAGEISKKDAKDFAKTKHKGLPEKKVTKESVENDKVDLILKTGVNNVLKQDNKEYDRGLLAQVNKDGSYDVAYWYEKYKAYPVEVEIDGKSVKKDAKNIHIKFHPQLKKKNKEEAKSAMEEESTYEKLKKKIGSKKMHDKPVTVDEGVMDVVRRYGKKKEERKPQKAMDAGARAKRKLARREYEKKVSPFVPDELKDHKTWNDFKKHI